MNTNTQHQDFDSHHHAEEDLHEPVALNNESEVPTH